MTAGIAARMMLALLLLAPLAGCGGEPMPFPVPESEMPRAPGLFTGESGSYDVPIVKGAQQPPSADAAPNAKPN